MKLHAENLISMSFQLMENMGHGYKQEVAPNHVIMDRKRLFANVIHLRHLMVEKIVLVSPKKLTLVTLMLVQVIKVSVSRHTEI